MWVAGQGGLWDQRVVSHGEALLLFVAVPSAVPISFDCDNLVHQWGCMPLTTFSLRYPFPWHSKRSTTLPSNPVSSGGGQPRFEK